MKHLKIIVPGALSIISIIICAFIYFNSNPTHSRDSISVITPSETKEIIEPIPEPKVEVPEVYEEVPTVSYWNPQQDGPALIKISLSKQVAYFYKGEHLAGVALISSGRKGQETPVGTFKVEQKIQDHRSGTYGSFVQKGTGRIVRAKVNRQKTKVPAGSYYVGAPMKYYLKFAPEIGIHSGFLPGHPDSSGCVRVTEIMARHFFENSEIGTPVIVEK